MIKSVKYLIVFICSLLIGTTVVFGASCSNATKKELSRKAANVKASYEVIDKSEEKELIIDNNKTTYRVPNYAFDISIYNLSEGIYAEVKTTKNDMTRNVNFSDTTDGIYTFKDNNFGEIYNYVITIKPTDECSNLTLRTLKFTKPRYNAYSEFDYCQNSSSYYCQKFIGTEINIDNTYSFINKLTPSKNNANNDVGEESNTRNSVWTLFTKNWKLYLILFVSIVLIVGVSVIIIIKRKKRELII